MQVRAVGRAVIIAGCLVTIISLAALKYADIGFGRGSETIWQLTTRLPVILTVVAVAAGTLAMVGFFVDRVLLAALAAGCCFWLFGQLFPAGAANYHGLKAGFWVSVVAALFAAAGGVLALIGYRVERKPAGSPAAPAPAGPGFAPVSPAASQTTRLSAPTDAPPVARAADAGQPTTGLVRGPGAARAQALLVRRRLDRTRAIRPRTPSPYGRGARLGSYGPAGGRARAEPTARPVRDCCYTLSRRRNSATCRLATGTVSSPGSTNSAVPPSNGRSSTARARLAT